MNFTGALEVGLLPASPKVWMSRCSGMAYCLRLERMLQKEIFYYLILVPRQHLHCKDRISLMNVTTAVRLKLKLNSSLRE